VAVSEREFADVSRDSASGVEAPGWVGAAGAALLGGSSLIGRILSVAGRRRFSTKDRRQPELLRQSCDYTPRIDAPECSLAQVRRPDGIAGNLKADYEYTLSANHARPFSHKMTIQIGYAGRLGHRGLVQSDLAQPLTLFKDPKSGQTWAQASKVYEVLAQQRTYCLSGESESQFGSGGAVLRKHVSRRQE
jgi:hypothetical protein